ncbi:MAG: homoserine kinase [Synergistaceae bacterium]|nr:homoserine kinase [Synergistaceae bacterium]MBQ6417509.1 homoserine kinase [Synergistaceae bacterium]MBQ6981052.1 homoserine kinase [Synergistaceae bacterium]MBR0186674.1 homoserine kinase [Synergistaceae bacterium]MBR0278417.1 homoserine kinase [Synergistaceae bacterium]
MIRLKVPATTANLGSGFDTLGMALNLYNIFTVTEILPEGEYRSEVWGEGVDLLKDARKNMLVTSYLKACDEWGLTPKGFAFESCNAVPLNRGLGSSSTAVVAGVTLANIISGANFPEAELLRVMTKIEGHPDNVVPCYIGGMTVSCWDGESLRYVRLPALPEDLNVIAAVPDFEVHTEDARRILPESVPFRDAVFNVSHASILCAAWAMGRWDLLRVGMEDRLHQTHRAKLFPGETGEKFFSEIANHPDCVATAISGSGPTMIAIVHGPAAKLSEAMCKIFTEGGAASHFFVLNCAPSGTVAE